jgi:deoxyxylulose-5-phosphate synthase
VALQNLPVVFCVDRAGGVGSDGPTQLSHAGINADKIAQTAKDILQT